MSVKMNGKLGTRLELVRHRFATVANFVRAVETGGEQLRRR